MFDLAGMICGHFNIPFWTFFGATLIGKAGIKCNLQAFAVVLLFSKDILDRIRLYSDSIPLMGFILSKMLASHEQLTNGGQSQTGWVGALWNLFQIGTVVYFLVSIVESLALNQMRRMDGKKKQ